MLWRGVSSGVTPGRRRAAATEEPLQLEPRGAIDAPISGLSLPREPTSISGWALIDGRPPRRVELSLGGHPLGPARLGIGRPDVRDATGCPAAVAAGFGIELDLRRWPGKGGDSQLEAVAIGDRGATLALTKPVTVMPELRPAPSPGSPCALPPGGSGPRVLVYTHQLNLGGAQLYLVDLLTCLASTGAADPVVVAALDGVTRARLEAAGVPVYVAGISPPRDAAGFSSHLADLTAWADRGDFDSVLVNTATSLSFPGGVIAAKLGLPVTWAIHESIDPALIWAGLVPELRVLAEKTLAQAETAIFMAEGTERLYRDAMPDTTRLVIPYGIEMSTIRTRRESGNGESARADAGIPSDAQVLICVGTIEPRKAQVPLAHAFDLIAGLHPAAHLVYVGASGTDDSELLRTISASLSAADRVHIVPTCTDVGPWYSAADLLVCASDVESLPRTVLEAMLWGVPVLATSIFGLPELIEDGATGWLCPPRDIDALANALNRALSSSTAERLAIAAAAQELVEERHSLADYGAQVAPLLAGRRLART